jgi:hypothetical protein
MLTPMRLLPTAAALNIPDELTCELMWKDKKREFSFDAVFPGGTSQDKVRAFVVFSARAQLD